MSEFSAFEAMARLADLVADARRKAEALAAEIRAEEERLLGAVQEKPSEWREVEERLVDYLVCWECAFASKLSGGSRNSPAKQNCPNCGKDSLSLQTRRVWPVKR